jgi:hypothetical protein
MMDTRKCGGKIAEIKNNEEKVALPAKDIS